MHCRSIHARGLQVKLWWGKIRKQKRNTLYPLSVRYKSFNKSGRTEGITSRISTTATTGLIESLSPSKAQTQHYNVMAHSGCFLVSRLGRTVSELGLSAVEQWERAGFASQENKVPQRWKGSSVLSKTSAQTLLQSYCRKMPKTFKWSVLKAQQRYASSDLSPSDCADRSEKPSFSPASSSKHLYACPLIWWQGKYAHRQRRCPRQYPCALCLPTG